MFRFQTNYFLTALFLLLVLGFIAIYVQDPFIRPYGGDFLVVIFLYCLLRSLVSISVINALLAVLLFAFVIEGLQAFHALKLLKLEGNKIASVVLGSHFEWLDMLLYALGALVVYLTERGRGETGKKKILNKN